MQRTRIEGVVNADGSQGGLRLESNPNWKGGRFLATSGYILVKDDVHPDLKRDGYSYEHRQIAEKLLGRKLNPGEIVHHRDGNKLNNDPCNIEILPGIAYHKLRHRKRQDLKRPDEINPVIGCGCGCGNTFLKYDSNNRPRKFLSGHYWRGKKR